MNLGQWLWVVFGVGILTCGLLTLGWAMGEIWHDYRQRQLEKRWLDQQAFRQAMERNT